MVETVAEVTGWFLYSSRQDINIFWQKSNLAKGGRRRRKKSVSPIRAS